MQFPFYKYQATGNDFVIVDNREGKYSPTVDEIKRICDRKFGIGADGLMLIEKHPSFDFNLIYYNADGSPSLCGNGSRAAVVTASALGIINGKAKFNAYDGAHEAQLLPNGNVRLKMNDVKEVKNSGDGVFLNTGSPHFIKWTSEVRNYSVFEEGKKIRYSEAFKPAGTNVNFVEPLKDNTIFVRTYERGVENETLSCGTGVTAAALAAYSKNYISPVSVKTLGGELSVEFKVSHDGSFTDIFLVGPAKMVFQGVLEL
ncbi:MAG TPA: diaminopimelate epimerase [Cyclobacteriaceae bacterium]|jgi:diaminopimelate epimerase|nr:diaminopimelate epimerase [Cyclobacteriaceae bacterium]